ncbi:hypothetical protein [Cytobacillus dafuensis]|uniref:WxL domain-containing protein n=1 Tax=Cytobacillus dafuensis TaxID=1742359 RepID=A0A5B8Z6A2_CYTDA|nr:hypothetical protein [Cytobacillus dafuensis]QED46916.1 hypothetical protein FSZ17_06335 [Cytobacillus dafuensis]
MKMKKIIMSGALTLGCVLPISALAADNQDDSVKDKDGTEFIEATLSIPALQLEEGQLENAKNDMESGELVESTPATIVEEAISTAKDKE